jgi:hypothetical protein
MFSLSFLHYILFLASPRPAPDQDLVHHLYATSLTLFGRQRISVK